MRLKRNEFTRELICYLVVWVMSIVYFWIMGKDDAMGYSITMLYFTLPLVTFVTSMIMTEKVSNKYIYLIPMFFSIMFALVPMLTFNLANYLTFGNNIFNSIDLTGLTIGLLSSILGVIVGQLHKKR